MKGYLIFVEGANAPEVVHDDFEYARRHAHQLARKNPGRDVMLLRIHKRIRYSEAGEYEKLPTHLPDPVVKSPSGRPTLRLNQLVHRT